MRLVNPVLFVAVALKLSAPERVGLVVDLVVDFLLIDFIQPRVFDESDCDREVAGSCISTGVDEIRDEGRFEILNEFFSCHSLYAGTPLFAYSREC